VYVYTQYRDAGWSKEIIIIIIIIIMKGQQGMPRAMEIFRVSFWARAIGSKPCSRV